MKLPAIKHLPLFILVFLLCAGTLYGQSKKELEVTVDNLNRQVQGLEKTRDSLNLALRGKDTSYQELNFLNDSLAGDLENYQRFYVRVLDKCLATSAEDLPVNQATALVDSLCVIKDTLSEGVVIPAVGLADSVTYLNRKVDSLSIANKAFRDILDLLLTHEAYPRSPGDFQGEWKLFLEPVYLVGEANQMALVTMNQVVMPDSLVKGMLTRMVFQEDDLAVLYFADGKRIRCFSKINNFNQEKTYSIDLMRSKEVEIRLFVTHVPRGLQISYEIPDSGKGRQFYFGYMRQ